MLVSDIEQSDSQQIPPPPQLSQLNPGCTPLSTIAQQHKVYRYERMMTPYDKLKSLPDAKQYLKPGMTFKQLDAIAHAISDNDAAKRLQEAKQQLFKTIFEQYQAA